MVNSYQGKLVLSLKTLLSCFQFSKFNSAKRRLAIQWLKKTLVRNYLYLDLIFKCTNFPSLPPYYDGIFNLGVVHFPYFTCLGLSWEDENDQGGIEAGVSSYKPTFSLRIVGVALFKIVEQQNSKSKFIYTVFVA